MDAVDIRIARRYADQIVTGDLTITKNSDGGITFSANGGQSVVTLTSDEVKGRGVESIQINSNNHLICTLDDDTTIDAGVLPSGSSTGGTTNYTDLTNKPSINSIELTGDKSLNDLGITNYDDTQVKQDKKDLQDNKVDKVTGKSLISDTEISRLANVDNYDDTDIKQDISDIDGMLLDNITFSSDYKSIILNRKNVLDPYTIPIASFIHNAKLTELNDIDATDIGDG